MIVLGTQIYNARIMNIMCNQSQNTIMCLGERDTVHCTQMINQQNPAADLGNCKGGFLVSAHKVNFCLATSSFCGATPI